MTEKAENGMRAGFDVEPGVREKAKIREMSVGEPEPETPSGKTSPGMRAGFEVDSPGAGLTEIERTAAEVAGTTTVELEGDDGEFPEPARFWSSPVFWVLILLLCFGGLQTWSMIAAAFAASSVTGIFWSAVFAVVFVLAVISVYREFGSVLTLKRVDEHRAEVVRICAGGTCADALRICRRIAEDSGAVKRKSWNDFVSRIQPHFSPREVFDLYEYYVLADTDERAKRIIVKRSGENGVIVALSPVAWLDMFLTLARSLRMIREISEVYGLQAGVWGRMQIYRRVIRNLVLIGMTDLATDAVTDMIGAGMAGKLSASLGQGVAAGIYSTRLGYMTVKAVRPLGISRKVITLAELRRDLLTGGEIRELIRRDLKK